MGPIRLGTPNFFLNEHFGAFLKHQENDPKCQKVCFFFIKLKDNDPIEGKLEKKIGYQFISEADRKRN